MGIGQLGQMSKMPISPNANLSQSSHAFNAICPKQAYHLTQTSICPKCSFAPIAQQCPFAMVLIFPGAHFPPMSIDPKCPFASNVNLPWCSFFLVPISPQCPPQPQCSTFPKCPFGPKCSFAANSLLVCPGTNFSWCSFSPSAHIFPQCSSIPSAYFPKRSFVPVPTCPLVPNTSHLPKGT